MTTCGRRRIRALRCSPAARSRRALVEPCSRSLPCRAVQAAANASSRQISALISEVVSTRGGRAVLRPLLLDERVDLGVGDGQALALRVGHDAAGGLLVEELEAEADRRRLGVAL